MLSKARFPLMALGLLALLTALWGGLVRLGWAWPLPWPTLFIAHGPLMVCGFLGTLIGVERAVALVIKRIIPKGGHEKAITVREMAMCKRKHGMLYSSLPARA